ncbi:MAG: hypothetical protein R3E90_07805 [Marinicella sp.]
MSDENIKQVRGRLDGILENTLSQLSQAELEELNELQDDSEFLIRFIQKHIVSASTPSPYYQSLIRGSLKTKQYIAEYGGLLTLDEVSTLT